MKRVSLIFHDAGLMILQGDYSLVYSNAAINSVYNLLNIFGTVHVTI